MSPQLPQAGVYECGVGVTPPNHNVFKVGGCPELRSELTRTELKHNKPFEVEKKMKERGRYLSNSGAAHLKDGGKENTGIKGRIAYI